MSREVSESESSTESPVPAASFRTADDVAGTLIDEERFARLAAEAESARLEVLAESRRIEEWRNAPDESPALEMPAASLSEYRERLWHRWADSELSESFSESSEKRLEAAQTRLSKALLSLHEEGMPEEVWVRTGTDGVLMRFEPSTTAEDSARQPPEEVLGKGMESEEVSEYSQEGEILVLYRAPWWAIESEIRWQESHTPTAHQSDSQRGIASARSSLVPARGLGGFPSPEAVAVRTRLDTANLEYIRDAMSKPSKHPAALQVLAGFVICESIGASLALYSASLWLTGAQSLPTAALLFVLGPVLATLLALVLGAGRINAESGGISLGSQVERAVLTGRGEMGESLGSGIRSRYRKVLGDADRTTGGTLWAGDEHRSIPAEEREDSPDNGENHDARGEYGQDGR